MLEGRLVGEEPIPKHGILPMRFEQGVRAIRLGQLRGRDQILESAVVGLAGELQHPA